MGFEKRSLFEAVYPMKITNIIHEYLDLMDRQRETTMKALEGMPEAFLWDCPQSGGWCIGEILDQTRVLNASTLPILRFSWFLSRGLAEIRRSKPYATDIDNVYTRPGFPMNSGWMWAPKRTAKKPASLVDLSQSLAHVHAQYRAFYALKDPDILGHITLFDPAIGRLNLIQALRVGLYHDQLHYEDALKLADEIKTHTSPVA